MASNVYPRQVFSTPEASIGFHTDCSFSYILSHLPGRLGNDAFEFNEVGLINCCYVFSQNNVSKWMLSVSFMMHCNTIFTGEYLGLTGARLNGKELIAAKMATQFVPSEVYFISSLHFNDFFQQSLQLCFLFGFTIVLVRSMCHG